MAHSIKLTAKHWTALVLATGFLGASGGFNDLIEAVQALSGNQPKIAIHIPFGFSFELDSKAAIHFLWKAVFSVLVSFLFTTRISALVADEQRTELEEAKKRKRDKEIDNLIRLLDEKSGITKIYPSEKTTNILDQPYADDILQQAKTSNTMCILTIGGYEFIGKRTKSLLWKVIHDRAELEVEVVLLDWLSSDAVSVIDERIKALRVRDTNYSKEVLVEQIRKTNEQLHLLKNDRTNNAAPIGIWVLNEHPIFRIIFFDKVAFVSAYERDCHGHESPMYRIEAREGPNKSSLYDSFLRFYRQAKRASVPAKTPSELEGTD